MREIPLTQGQKTLIDDDQFELVSQYKWCALWNPTTNSFYATSRIVDDNGKRRTIYLHRLILGLDFGDPRKADHIDHNTLDNRVCNLRVATSGQSVANRRLRSDNASKYIGVSWSKKDRVWRARIQKDGKQYHLGHFKTKREAAIVYDDAARRFFGSFAKLNFS